MLIVLVEAVAANDSEAARLMDAARAVILATRREEGCISYDYAQDLIDPTIIRVAERWRDEAAMRAHLAAPHVCGFFAFLESVKLKSLMAKVYDAAGERDLFDPSVAS